MRILIIAVGRARRDPTGTLFDAYAKRLPWPIDVKEVEVRGKHGQRERRNRESRLLLEAAPKTGITVALDRSGKSLTSEGFAKHLKNWRDESVSHVAFFIGGAEGVDDQVLARADLVVSLGAMTWPHMLVRVMLVEQLYRASTILAGHPYHRGT